MAKHEAVDRLMALATEKRADRIPSGAPVTPGAAAASASDASAAGEILPPQEARVAETSTGIAQPPVVKERTGPTAGERGRQILQSIRPLLPAVAGAMRLVDHGVVQAVARLLTLLGGNLGSLGLPAPTAKQAAASPPSLEQEQFIRGVLTLEAEQHQARRDLDARLLQVA